MEESIGKRIAQLRQQHGWTQQALAERLAISRVAVSHIEMDLNLPSERTITLLAGLFKVSPYELVAGTTYPNGKIERLPSIVCQFTRLELDLAVMENDLTWLRRTNGRTGVAWQRWQAEHLAYWQACLANWSEQPLDAKELDLLAQARDKISAFFHSYPGPESSHAG